MRYIDYAIATVAIGIFFLFIGALVLAALQWFFTETLPTFLWPPPNQPKRSRPPRFAWLEELRAKYQLHKLYRLATKIERKLERRRIGSPWDLG